MFSGIVEETAVVTGIELEQENVHLTLKCSFVEELGIDQSVAHNGVCLTVVSIQDGTYTVTAMKETLDEIMAFTPCPECGSFSTLESENDMLYCRHCGMKVRLNDYGYFTDIYGNKPRFETILDWDKWQQKYLHEYLPSVTDENVPLFSDDGLRLSAVTPGVGTEVLARGTLTMYKDRMEIGGRVIKLSDIEKISITLTDTMLFTAAGQYYEIKGSKPYSALKYLISSRLLIGKEYK